MITVNWQDGRALEAVPPSGNRFSFDAYPAFGGQDRGPTPIEAFLASLAACSAMDVLSILEKKKQKVTSYRVEVDGDRTEDGVYPRPFVNLRIRHLVEGEDLDPAAVEQAVKLSDEKYCSIAATLRAGATVTSTFEVSSAEFERGSPSTAAV